MKLQLSAFLGTAADGSPLYTFAGEPFLFFRQVNESDLVGTQGYTKNGTDVPIAQFLPVQVTVESV